jgi:hypothetical protein
LLVSLEFFSNPLSCSTLSTRTCGSFASFSPKILRSVLLTKFELPEVEICSESCTRSCDTRSVSISVLLVLCDFFVVFFTFLVLSVFFVFYFFCWYCVALVICVYSYLFYLFCFVLVRTLMFVLNKHVAC